MTAPAATIDRIRAASRRLVREFGFMGGAFAGTDLPPSAVHALIEIEAAQAMTARDLAILLRLEKSSVSRLLRKLVLSGDIREEPGAADARTKALSLTPAGRARVAAIHGFARAQVAGALDRLPASTHATVLDGLDLYATALAGDPAPPAPAPAIDVVEGYRPGVVGRIVEMHAVHYAATAGFGRRFEAVVAGGLAAFCDRLDRPSNGLWTAVRDGRVVGAVAVDGEDIGPGVSHLRWFIVAPEARGGGVGRRLLDRALAFSDARGFAEMQLWTFAGLDAARHLYEAHGFVLVEERPGRQWGEEVLEQRFARTRS
ncbi:GNAT family N-acetyltransferase [Methyloraptor flagellatus]|uniref:Helix-turn-helix domain-containing GNAT family N-acetyltransferase n=1 Tax=Methyloraptor flagellatus TaxID=3162530 RepID=A0AAU7X869_9HYPH